MHSNNGHLECTGVSMESFAEGLAARLGRPVIDETGLAGRFDFTLDSSRMQSRLRRKTTATWAVLKRGHPCLPLCRTS